MDGTGKIRRVCSLVDLSTSSTTKDNRPYGTFGGKCMMHEVCTKTIFIQTNLIFFF